MVSRIRAGAPQKPIPDDAEAKPLGEYLRALREALGEPTFRILGTMASTAQNNLSQLASGKKLRGWDSYEVYLRAIDAYAVKHNIDVAAAMRSYAEQNDLNPQLTIQQQARSIWVDLNNKRTAAPKKPAPNQPGAATTPAITVPEAAALLNSTARVFRGTAEASTPRNPLASPPGPRVTLGKTVTDRDLAVRALTARDGRFVFEVAPAVDVTPLPPVSAAEPSADKEPHRGRVRRQMYRILSALARLMIP